GPALGSSVPGRSEGTSHSLITISIRRCVMAQQIGICLVGAGRAGLIHAHNFQGKIPQAKVVAVVDPNQEAAEKAAKELGVDRWYTSVEPALDNRAVDAVVIATPTRHHKAIAVAASEAGKHILCEKPMAMNEE